MKNLERLLIKGFPFASSLILPFWALAQGGTGPVAQQPPLQTLNFGQVSGIGCTLVSWIFTILIIVAIIFVLIAAFNYLTAGGDEEKVKLANHRLIYAAVAVAVAVAARAFPLLVAGLLGGTFSGC